MNDREFAEFYRKLMEQYTLAPDAAASVLQRILLHLSAWHAAQKSAASSRKERL